TGAQPVLLPYYRYFELDMRNDWMTNVYFPGHPRRSDKAAMRWHDERAGRFLDLKPETTDEADLYWPLNHVEVRLQTEPGRMTRELGLVLKTITPNFDRFEVSIDQSSPFSYRSSYLNWSLKPGINRLDVRSVNQLGVKGPVSSLELRWAPG